VNPLVAHIGQLRADDYLVRFLSWSSRTAASSAANILRRGVNPDRARALADHLEESGRRAARTVEDLRRHVPPDRRS